MTAAARKPAAKPSALTVFTARCQAKALLWQAGEIDLHDAIDELQGAAVRDGLVAELGQDEVQRPMADAFTANPSLFDVELSSAFIDEIERVCYEVNAQAAGERHNRAAASTVEALMLALRSRGAAALAEPETRRRLADLSSAQVREILARLLALRPDYPVIDDELLFLIGEQLG